MAIPPTIPRDELLRRVRAFPRWHYEFDLGGVVTPIFDPAVANRHRQRRAYLFAPLLAACGGSLTGRRVLDLGCNAGFWSLAAIDGGCAEVVGVDGRSMHLEQAELVFAAKGVDRRRYRFLHGDVLGAVTEPLGRFDIVLCLGLLYHVGDPLGLLRRATAACADLLVIDTNLYPADEAVLALVRDDAADPRNALASSLVCFPSLAAVIAMVTELGFHGLVLRPQFDDYTGSADFADGTRRAFLCARHSDLSSLQHLAERAF